MTRFCSTLKEVREKGGSPIIGCAPLYPPVELLNSMRLLPVVLWGLTQEIPRSGEADKHLQNYACAVSRRLLQLLIQEGADLFDGLLFYNACDTLRNLPEIIHEGMMGALGKGLPLFRIHVPMTTGETGRAAYIRNEIQRLIHSLEHQLNVTFSEERFRESVARHDHMKGLCLELELAVSLGRMGFHDFRAALTAANFMGEEERIALLESRIASLPPAHEPNPGRVRVFVSGILPPPPEICRIMDEVGIVVSGNDIASLHRSYAPGPSEWSDAADYYVKRYTTPYPCTTLLHTADRRIDAVMTRVLEKRSDGFLFFGEKFCEYEYFEYPYLENRLKGLNLPSLAMEIAMDDGLNVENARTRIEAFHELLSQRRLRQHSGGGNGP